MYGMYVCMYVCAAWVGWVCRGLPTDLPTHLQRSSTHTPPLTHCIGGVATACTVLAALRCISLHSVATWSVKDLGFRMDDGPAFVGSFVRPSGGLFTALTILSTPLPTNDLLCSAPLSAGFVG